MLNFLLTNTECIKYFLLRGRGRSGFLNEIPGDKEPCVLIEFSGLRVTPRDWG